MTIADITLTAFTLCNSLRVVAYVPQIARAARDRSGAQAISFATWGLFLVSHASAAAYALVNNSDWTMASVFLGNAVGCGVIVLITAWKRCRHRRTFAVIPAAKGKHVRFAHRNPSCKKGEEQRTPIACEHAQPISMDFLLEVKALGFANHRSLLRKAGERAAAMARIPEANEAAIRKDRGQAWVTPIRRMPSCMSMHRAIRRLCTPASR
jgi:hypothetical protein